MARILYGVHGTGHGHAMRGLTIARALPQHEFLFIANDDAPSVLEAEYRVKRLPNLGTAFKDYKVDFSATLGRALPLLWHRKEYIKELLKIIEDFKPDVCMVDLEYFVPRAAKLVSLPCLTLDHQHIITCCKHDLPQDLRWDAFFQGLSPRFLFPPTDYNLLISFYAPPVLPDYRVKIAPPILRSSLLKLSASDEGHILVYQSNSRDRALIDFLQHGTGRKAYVFGYENKDRVSGNIHFRKRREEEFIELLSGCSYVIQGGSHTLMGEALYMGKPVLSLPIEAMVEQRFNAFYLEKLGYGRKAAMGDLDSVLLEKFEEDLPAYRERIKRGNFLGNEIVFDMVDNFAKNGRLAE